MSRIKKDGQRANGIQSKKGFLYIVLSCTTVRDGVKTTKKKWISTGLKDTPENVKKAVELRSMHQNDMVCCPNTRSTLLSDFLNQILEQKRRELSDTTYAAYFYRAKRITDYFGNIKLKDLTKPMIETFLDDLFTEHQLSPITVKDIKVFFGSCLDQAVKEGIITSNYVKAATINKRLSNQFKEDPGSDDDFFSYKEAQFFLEKISDHDLYEYFYLTLFFGLRREECLGLKWSAVDLINKTLKINHTVTKGMTITRSNTTKTQSSAREYPLTDDQVKLFLHLKEKEDNNRTLFGNAYKENDYIFKHADGSLYYPDYPSKAFRKLITKIPELPQNITLHGLRVSCVSILVHQGKDIKSIQKWVGHSNIDTTLKIYAKVKDKESKMEISNVMSDIIPPKKYNIQ